MPNIKIVAYSYLDLWPAGLLAPPPAVEISKKPSPGRVKVKIYVSSSQVKVHIYIIDVDDNPPKSLNLKYT